MQNLLGTTIAPDPSATTVPGSQTTTLDGQVIPILAIGDSVMLGAANILTERGITVDALKSRPFRQALEIANYVKSIGRLGEFVIIHLGTNNYVDQETLDEIMVPLKDVEGRATFVVWPFNHIKFLSVGHDLAHVKTN